MQCSQLESGEIKDKNPACITVTNIINIKIALFDSCQKFLFFIKYLYKNGISPNGTINNNSGLTHNVKPPYMPEMGNSGDVSHFDKVFTNEEAKLTAPHLMLSPEEQKQFKEEFGSFV